MKRRAAVEPVIGHVKIDHRTDRNYLKGRDGDRATPSSPPPATTYAGSSRWLAELFVCLVPDTGLQLLPADHRLSQLAPAFFTDDLV